jgi:hypothetical protein
MQKLFNALVVGKSAQSKYREMYVFVYKWIMDFLIIPAKVITFMRFVGFTACW